MTESSIWILCFPYSTSTSSKTLPEDFLYIASTLWAAIRTPVVISKAVRPPQSDAGEGSALAAWLLGVILTPLKRLRTLSIVLLMGTIVSGPAIAQVDSLLGPGLVPGGTYQHSDFNSINMLNGRNIIHIPFYSLPQRGKLSLSFSLVSDTGEFRAQKNCTNPSLNYCIQILGGPGAGVRLVVDQDMGAPPTVYRYPPNSNTFYNVYAVQDWSGASHQLGYDQSNPSLLRATDGSGFLYKPATNPDGSSNGYLATLYEPSGIRHIYGPSLLSQTIVDPDDNSIRLQDVITDSLGRTIPVPEIALANLSPSTAGCPTIPADFQPLVGSNSWTVPGPTGSSQTFLFCYSSVSYRTSFYTQPQQCGPQCRESWSTGTEVQSIVLPNGTFWGFVYDAANLSDQASSGYAQIRKILLPEGGSISYEYTNFYNNCAGNIAISRAVSKRTLDDGRGSVSVWTYSFSGSGLNIATDPFGNDTRYTFSSIGGGCSLYETQRESFQGSVASGRLLSTKSATYRYSAQNPQSGIFGGSGSSIGVFPATVVTSLYDSSGTVTTSTTKEFHYDDGGFLDVQPACTQGATTTSCKWSPSQQVPFGLVTSTITSDGGGNIVNKVQTRYLYQDNPSYFAANFLNLIESTTTVDPSSDAAAAQVAYGYDEDNGSPQGVLGHQTSVTPWLSSGTSPTSKVIYNSQGMPINKIDAKGNNTTIIYDATGAFPSQIKSPDTQGVHHIETYVHDATTGAITSHTDQNQKETTFTYDLIGRPLTIGYPDGGIASFDYHNDALPLKTTKTELATPNPSIVTSTVYDGLGRVAYTSVDSDPACSSGSRADITYDGLGRTQSISNPYCFTTNSNTSDPTYGLTAYAYDALGRITQLTRPDGSIAANSYSGNCSTSTDEAGRKRTSCIDVLGRLVEVDEPGGPGSPAAPGSGAGTVSGGEQSTQVLVQAALYGSGSVHLSGNPQWKAVTNASTGGTSSVTLSGSEQQYPAGVNPGVGTVTINGAEQSPKLVAAATTGTGSVTINGALQSKQVLVRAGTQSSAVLTIGGSPQAANSCVWDGLECAFWNTIYNSGEVDVDVAGFHAVSGYNDMDSNSSTIAAGLAISLNSSGLVSAVANGSAVTLTSIASTSAANYRLSYPPAVWDLENCYYDNINYAQCFTGPSFYPTRTPGNMSGGQDAQYTTIYDSGTTTLTINGTSYRYPWNGAGTSAPGIASGLASLVNAGAGPVQASVSGGTIALTAKTAGVSGNYSFSIVTVNDSANFPSPAFPPVSSGPTLSGGKDAVFVYDTGSVSVTVNNHTSPPAGSPPVVWGQGSTAAGIASALTAAITADAGASVAATSSGNLITLTAKAKGSVSNYSLAASFTYDTGHFSQSSFTTAPSGSTLTGGWPDAQAVDKGTMTITINGHDYTSSWGQTATPGNIASDLVSKITDPAVGASLVGNVVYLDPKQPGAAYSLATANTHDTANFPQSSFNQANAISDYGLATVTVNGKSDSIPWAGRSTPSSIAADLASKIQADPAAVVSATAASDTVSLTSRQPGLVSNYNLSSTSSFDSVDFGSGSFAVTASGAKLVGGLDAIYKTVFDTGVVSLAVSGFQASVPYQQGSTASSVALALASQFNAPHSGSPVAALASGSAVSLISSEPGLNTNYSLSPSFSSTQPGLFPQPSFSLAVSGPALTGGTDQIFDLSSPSVTQYTYDALGNLKCVVQKGQDTTPFTDCSSAPATWRPRSFVYDSLSRLTSAHNPESGTQQFTYDANSNITSKTDARGFTINFSPPDSPIDALNRVTKKTYSIGSANSASDQPVFYFYDQTAYNGLTIVNGIGRRTGMSDASGASAWSYDVRGRTAVEQQTINGITKSTGYRYDLVGNVSDLTYPDGEVVVFGYNGAGRPTSAVDNNLGIKFADQATYLPGGQRMGVIYGSVGGGAGITTTNRYNQRLQPIFLSASSPTQTIFSLGYDFHLGRGDNGNVYQITNNRDDDRTQHFSYDGLNRIQSAWTSGPKWGETFTIDTWGNLTSRGLVAGKTYYENLAVSAIATAGNQLTGSGLKYDASGNMINDGGGQYVYDAENRISSTAGVTFTYNGDGTRVMKSDGVIDWGPGPLSRSDLAGNVTRNFIFFGGKRIARRVLPANTIDYMFSDYLGSLGVMTDADGNIEGESDYYPFGGEQVISGALTAYKFTGKERDSAETGLDYFGARFYSSALGRFMSPDWSEEPEAIPNASLSNPQSLNLYGYVLNSPMRNTDPDGHKCESEANGDVHCDVQDTKKVHPHVDFPFTPLLGVNYPVAGAHYTPMQRNNLGGCPLGTCHTFNGLFPPLRRTFPGLQVFLGGIGTLGSLPGMLEIGDILDNPGVLGGKTPAEVQGQLGDIPPEWHVETLGQGSQKGNGMVLREYGPNGQPTGRMIQWHPGGGHHGPSPYWKVSSGPGGTVRVGPQFKNP